MRLRYLVPRIVLLLIPLTGQAEVAPTPTELVQETVDAVIALLKEKSLDPDIRRDKIRALIDDSFDFRLMSQRALSANWKQATPDQQERFVDLFSQLLEWAYIGRIEAYTDEKVRYVDEKHKKGRAQVDTLILSGSTEIPVNYRLHKMGGRWRVYDVVIEQVSLIRNYRSSYREIVKQQGIDGLLAQMDNKLKELKAKADAAAVQG
jgi:phospholipid transport system substrate-binding protein